MNLAAPALSGARLCRDVSIQSALLSGRRGTIQPQPGTPPARITPRERQILVQIVLGRTNREIGAALAISAKTVDWHRMHLMRKLAVHNAAGLVRCALQQHLVDAVPEPAAPDPR
jgi:DNA-binding CsgD family transcriptional regulator